MPKDFSAKRLVSRVKKLLKRGVKLVLSSNLAFALLALPLPSNFIARSESNLIIPEQTLASSFNIPGTDQPDPATIQIPVNYKYVSQKFSSFHPGIDLPSEFASAVKPIKAGVVELAEYSPFGYGNEVLIDHGDGLESLYAHLSKIEVKKGDTVTINSELGLVGSTGHSTGPHLHLEIHKDGVPVNPLNILPPLTHTTLLSYRELTEKEASLISNQQ